MIETSTFTQNAWLSGDYVDERRPVTRATIQKVHTRRYEYHQTEFVTWKHEGRLGTILFNQDGPIRELPGIESFKWTRSFDSDVATATLVMANVNWLQDQPSANEAEFDFPGWYTPNRGDGDFFDEWNYQPNSWLNWLIPDRLVRTYQGYGTNGAQDPEEDSNLYPSGTWLIDDVKLGTDGRITLDMRDVGRILVDDVIYLGVIPNEIYPLYFEQQHSIDAPDELVASSWTQGDYLADSNQRYLDEGLMDGNAPAVKNDGTVHTHKGAHAFDGNVDTHWLSAGSSDPGAFEYLQFAVNDGDDVAAIRVNPRGGPFKCYVSVQIGGTWKGVPTVPYQRADDGPDLESADLPYVKAFHIDQGKTTQVKLPRVYSGADKIRLTFQSYWDSGIGAERHYRVGVQEASYATEISTVKGTGHVAGGNYNDYSDIIKWLIGWNGFYWPANAVEHRVDGDRPHNNGPDNGSDWTLPKGGVFGDIRKTHTQGLVKLDREVWDKQTIMDAISTVRDIVGFNFWINERGGAMWRLPNWFNKGNYIQPADGGGTSVHTRQVITIDERTTLMNLAVTLSSKNIRERIFVSNANGRYGTTVRGYNPAPVGFRRTAGWTDWHFKSRAECRRMANLIAIRQFYKYRQNSLTIAANPAIQIDDQVVIKERLTGEGYLHHVEAISSDWSADDGKWTYDITTSWLGPEAFTKLAWKPQRLDGDTKAYLQALGALPA